MILSFRGKVILIVLFFLAFFSSGGWHLLDQGATPPWNRWILAQDEQDPIRRIHRIFFIRQELDAKLSRPRYVKIRDIPLALQQATIAVEDNRFYRHPGFDVEGILRAALVNLQNGETVEGGSTITQQLVKNLFLTQEKSLGRKAEEFILAISLEAHYSKEQILEMYLNSIYYGSGAYGIGEAAKVYFDKTPLALTIPESALLAGLPNAPSLYSPYVNLPAAKSRQAIVLQTMLRHGFIGPQTAEDARNAPLYFAR